MKILLGFGADVNIQQKDGWTALMFAARYSNTSANLETVKILLGFGADINIQSKDGWTALTMATKFSNTDSNPETVKILLSFGADVNIQNKDGCTALMLAARYSDTDSNPETVKLLLKFGADPKIKDNRGNDVVKETKEILLEIENENLRRETESMEMSPFPGRKFIELLIDQYKDEPNLYEKIMEGYIPLIESHFKDIINS